MCPVTLYIVTVLNHLVCSQYGSVQDAYLYCNPVHSYSVKSPCMPPMQTTGELYILLGFTFNDSLVHQNTAVTSYCLTNEHFVTGGINMGNIVPKAGFEPTLGI